MNLYYRKTKIKLINFFHGYERKMLKGWGEDEAGNNYFIFFKIKEKYLTKEGEMDSNFFDKYIDYIRKRGRDIFSDEQNRLIKIDDNLPDESEIFEGYRKLYENFIEPQNYKYIVVPHTIYDAIIEIEKNIETIKYLITKNPSITRLKFEYNGLVQSIDILKENSIFWFDIDKSTKKKFIGYDYINTDEEQIK